MNDADRDAIQDLFARLRAAEAANPTRDPAAEAYIRDRLEQHPAAAYYMAQTVIAQEHALRAARDRIAAAEGDDGRYAPPVEQQRSGGGFFGNLFGGGDRRPVPRQPGPWDQPAQAMPGGMLAREAGGGFLAGAAQTAVGVAGGMMLGNMLTDLFEGDRHEGRQSFADTDGSFGGGQGLGDFGGDSAGFGDDGAGGFFDDQG